MNSMLFFFYIKELTAFFGLFMTHPHRKRSSTTNEFDSCCFFIFTFFNILSKIFKYQKIETKSIKKVI